MDHHFPNKMKTALCKVKLCKFPLTNNYLQITVKEIFKQKIVQKLQIRSTISLELHQKNIPHAPH